VHRSERIGLPGQHGVGPHERIGRERPAEEMVQRSSEAIQIAARVGALTPDLLERRIGPRVAKDAARRLDAARGLIGLLRGQALGQPEVQQHHVTLRC
jgi:hypothetical protein